MEQTRGTAVPRCKLGRSQLWAGTKLSFSAALSSSGTVRQGRVKGDRLMGGRQTIACLCLHARQIMAGCRTKKSTQSKDIALSMCWRRGEPSIAQGANGGPGPGTCCVRDGSEAIPGIRCHLLCSRCPAHRCSVFRSIFLLCATHGLGRGLWWREARPGGRRPFF